MKKTIGLVLCLLSISVFAADEKVKEVDFVSLCKKECPGTKKNKDVFECAEAKESDPEFKKSKCGIEYAKYEAAHGGHHDKHDGHAH